MVDLPEPDGPMMATYSFRRMSSVTPRSARIRSSPISVLAGQVPDADDLAHDSAASLGLGGVGLRGPGRRP